MGKSSSNFMVEHKEGLLWGMLDALYCVGLSDL